MTKHRFKHTGDASDILSVLFEGLGEGVILTDMEGIVTRVGGSSEIITGRRASAMIGCDIGEVMGIGGQFDSGAFALDECEGWSQIVCRGARADGTSLTLRLKSRVYRDESGRPAGAVHLFSETSLQENLQKRFVEYQRLAGLGELSAAVVHEVGNPISVILGFAHVLIQQNGDDPGGEIRKRIFLEANRCRGIVDRLLDYSRSSSRAPTPAPISLREVAVEVLDLLSYRLRSRGLETTLDWSPDTPLVKADAGEVKQVILNLLLNAADASPPGTAIIVNGAPFVTEVSVGGDSLLSPRPKLLKKTWVRVTVKDRGTGLAGGDTEKYFAPFYSTKQKGGGLGLSVCRRIAEQLGGSLKLETREGGGVSAVMELPGFTES